MNYFISLLKNRSKELNMKQVLLLIFTIFILIGCNNTYQKALISPIDSSTIIITEVNLFDGIHEDLLENQNVIIQNGQITSISSKTPKHSSEAQYINGIGKTLMPGFIDAHVHLSGSGAVFWDNVKADPHYNLKAYLYSGITTVYDLGGISSDIEKLSVQIDNGIVGPDIYHTHIPITVKNSHPIPLTKEMLPWPLKIMANSVIPTISSVDDAQETIDNYLKKNVDYVKITCDQIPHGTPEMSKELLTALISECHKNNKKVFVHVGSAQNAINALNAGADVLAHGIWRSELSPEEADSITSFNKPIIYTISGFVNVDKINKGLFVPSEDDTTLVPKEVLEPVSNGKGLEVHKTKTMSIFFNDVSENEKFWKNNFDLLYSRGANIIIGTDSSLPGTYAGSTYYQEIDFLKKFGMSNYHILKGGTYSAAILFQTNPNFGSVEVGKKANLLLVNGNPMEDIDLVKNPHSIFKNGQLIERITP